jgi:hypothetical protein
MMLACPNLQKILIIGALLVIGSPLAHGRSANSDSAATQIYEQLKTLDFDPGKIAAVENLNIKRPHAKFLFKKGTFYFSEAVAGEITGAVFFGDGVFEFTPPDQIERYQVRRFLEKDSLRENFSAAYFRFTAHAAADILSKLTFAETKIPGEVGRMHETITKDFLDDLGYNLSSRILADLLNKPAEGLFFAALERHEANVLLPNYLIYSFDPQAREDVALFQSFPNRAQKPFYTVCSVPRQADSIGQDSLAAFLENKDLIEINHYNLQVELEKNGKVKVAAELSFLPLRDSLRCIDLNLQHDLKVDSVKDAAGAAVTFIREKKESGFAAIFPTPLNQRQQTLVVYYNGKLLEPAGDLLFLKDKTNWFPRHGYLKPATFDMIFQHSDDWDVLAVGRFADKHKPKKEAVSRWVQNTPALTAAFAFGNFESTQIDSTITIYSSHARSKKSREEVGRAVEKSIRFFEDRLQMPFSSHLNVVESVGWSSQSYPGILLLSTAAFQEKAKGAVENHVGHEVSHQWWGNVVGWRTYHDQWLSEALAEYCGALLAEHAVKDEKIFFEILEGWRNDLLHKGHIGVSLGLRRFGFSKDDLVRGEGMAAGPIWLGQRLGSKFPVDYYVTVYEKGAYALHMLRTLLRDFESGSDERFWAMLADFAATFKGRSATTLDFKDIVEKHVGESMEWFFNQWILGVEIPTYVYSYTLSNSGNEYWVDLNVRQEEVTSDFKMFIAIGIELSEKKLTQLIWMQTPEQTFRLGPFSEKPSKVTFNEFDGVLARIKQK